MLPLIVLGGAFVVSTAITVIRAKRAARKAQTSPAILNLVESLTDTTATVAIFSGVATAFVALFKGYSATSFMLLWTNWFIIALEFAFILQGIGMLISVVLLALIAKQLTSSNI
jgi:hypothetical protein